VTDDAGKSFVVAKGAPQAIVDLAKPASDLVEKIVQTVAALAAKGSRALGVARSTDGGATWSLLSILPMFDPPRWIRRRQSTRRTRRVSGSRW
jgi:H+-transporting ATPase